MRLYAELKNEFPGRNIRSELPQHFRVCNLLALVDSIAQD